jgi:hypothetical protein
MVSFNPCSILYGIVMFIFMNTFGKMLKSFCGIPGARFIAPIFMSFINVPCLLGVFLPLLGIIMGFVPPFHFEIFGLKFGNHDTDSVDPESKNWKMGSAFAFYIYYVICVLWIGGIMITVCKLDDTYDLNNIKDNIKADPLEFLDTTVTNLLGPDITGPQLQRVDSGFFES